MESDATWWLESPDGLESGEAGSLPPFETTAGSVYFCLVVARRVAHESCRSGGWPTLECAFQRAIDAGAEGTLPWNGLAFARRELGDRAGALAALRRSLAIDPNQPKIAAAFAEMQQR